MTGPRREIVVEVLGPWSLETSRRFWEGFAPAQLGTQQQGDALETVFRVERDWSLAEVHVTQQGSTASLTVLGDGDLDQAAAQACRFLSVDIDARALARHRSARPRHSRRPTATSRPPSLRVLFAIRGGSLGRAVPAVTDRAGRTVARRSRPSPRP